MSVCDEGWELEPFGGYCPALSVGVNELYWCLMGVFDEVRNDPRPDTCPYAPILRALPDASEERLTKVREVLEKTIDNASKRQVCPNCRGTGEIFKWVQTEKTKIPTHKIGYLDDRECPTCKGTGKRRQDEV